MPRWAIPYRNATRRLRCVPDGSSQTLQGAANGTQLCVGDSGGPWSIAVGGDQNAEKLVFALTSGLHGNRSAPWLGRSDWSTLLTAKLGFVRDTSRARGLPIICTTRTDLGPNYRYRQCYEGAAVPPQTGGGGDQGDPDRPPTHENYQTTFSPEGQPLATRRARCSTCAQGRGDQLVGDPVRAER